MEACNDRSGKNDSKQGARGPGNNLLYIFTLLSGLYRRHSVDYKAQRPGVQASMARHHPTPKELTHYA